MLVKNALTFLEVLESYYTVHYFGTYNENKFNEYFETILKYVSQLSVTHINLMYKNVTPQLLSRIEYYSKMYDDPIHSKLIPFLITNDQRQLIAVAFLIIKFDDVTFDNYLEQLNDMFGVCIENISANMELKHKSKLSRNLLTLSNKKLSILPLLTEFSNVIELNVSCNSLENINEIQHLKSLKKILCQNNKLTSIPLVDSLEEINCFHNQIVSISDYKNLKRIYCTYNKIVSISQMDSLTTLECSMNNIKTLPCFPKLIYLDCEHNPLSKIPYMEQLEILCIRGTNVTHLPQFKKLKQLSGSDYLIALPYMTNPMTRLYCPSLPIGNHNMIEQTEITEYLQRKSNIIARFRELYFSNKFKTKFIKFLWEKVRRPMIEFQYHPVRILKLIEDNTEEWEEILDKF